VIFILSDAVGLIGGNISPKFTDIFGSWFPRLMTGRFFMRRMQDDNYDIEGADVVLFILVVVAGWLLLFQSGLF
jgi:hypothetical protein